MKLEERINAFAELGRIITGAIQGEDKKFSAILNNLVISQEKDNAWFTADNVRMALKAIGSKLTSENLTSWTSRYSEIEHRRDTVTVGVVMAGNIPLVGFHDFLSVLISGNMIIARTSSKDSSLIREISHILCYINPEFNRFISFTDGVLKDFDLIIATGSDNSSRYFEYYFGKYPHIIRKNRSSIAVLEGNETSEELGDLGTDIFSYFGLGCRNVSKVYLPEGYDIINMVQNWNNFSDIINHNKYANNYDFNKAIWMVNREKFTDTGYLLLKESTELSSPVAVLFYEYYDNERNLQKKLSANDEKTQCICGKKYIPFGKAQYPELWDYADNLDTLEFLLKIKSPGIR
jgi:hypothetical protein